MDTKIYHSPLETRYASAEMLQLLSEEHKVTTWRMIWTELAQAQLEAGYQISKQQISEMRENQSNIDFEMANRLESEIRHDVMAHLKTYCHVCPLASPIIHLGATSNDITDNADVIIQRQALDRILELIARCLYRLSDFIRENSDLVAIAYTHYQPAQATTYGKRACLWADDLLNDLLALQHVRENLKMKGFKGATGSQDSYFDILGDFANVNSLENNLAKHFGFEKVFKVTGQTYSRKQDISLISALSSVAASIHKICTDIRLLSHDCELAEPFHQNQIGSSAMPYKRNPILSERCCSLSRHLMSLIQNPLMTLSTQWLERSLDDSANRRVTIAESFLVADSILNTLQYIIQGLSVRRENVTKNIMKHLPFMATEKVLMEAVKRGGNRQDCHAKLREYALKAVSDGSDLLSLITEQFPFVKDKMNIYNDPLQYIGCIPHQVDDFLNNDLLPAIRKYEFGQDADIIR